MAAASPFAFGEFSCYEGRGTYRLVQAEIQQYFREITEDYESAMYGFISWNWHLITVGKEKESRNF
ncbi:MAG: hypothetical protein ACLR6B_17215 [Blautia sp.]